MADIPICEGGKGQVLPLLGDWEREWDGKLKVLLYGAGLVYCFLGVSIVADLFMAAIEQITSRKRVRRVAGTPYHLTSNVWNDTIANLTLMALGSSAPEILLSLNDIFKRNWYSGKLGPSTIVGSAAFNLFVIIAVCVNSVPDGEVRRIKATGVFFVTAFFSIFAYVWVLYIVSVNSSNVIEVWEGVCTFMFFPCLVFTSYAADVGWLSKASLCACLKQLMPAAKDEERGGEEPSVRGVLWWACGCLCTSACWALELLCAACSCLSWCWRRRQHAQAPDDAECGMATSDSFDPDAPLLDEHGNPIASDAGILTFGSDVLEVPSDPGSEKEYTVQVFRKNGTSGRVSTAYRMEMLTATPGYDYVERSGELHFRDGVTTAEITLTILPKGTGERNDAFQVVLEDAGGGVEYNPDSDGGSERCLLTVTIVNPNAEDGRLRTRMIGVLDSLVNLKEMQLGVDAWREQITDAIYLKAGDDGDDGDAQEPSCGDRILHCIWFPWQFLFAVFTPPPAFIGGWICFWCSLFHIGWITVIISDLAELFGCAATIEDEITAIIFVALGTSVPDLFASRTAAKHDEWADASIVNVTGSNSVNVFLGIGLPWMGAAFYWSMHPDDAEWAMRYGGDYPNGSFVVTGGNLAYSVAVFTLAACACLTVIQIRRYAFGGELGGQSDTKAYSSFFFFLLWAFYIALSVWKITTQTEDIMWQAMSVVVSVVAIFASMVIFGLFRRLLKVSKRYIGEEGFWGIIVACLIIGGRMLVFLVFQYQW